MNVLRQLEIYNDNIEQSKRQYGDAYDRLTSVTHSMTHSNVMRSSDPHRFDQIAIKRNQLEQAERKWLELQRYVLKWMNDCPELSRLERIVILFHYFNGSTFEEIAESTDCSIKQLFGIQKKILALAPDADTLRTRYAE